MKTELTTIDKLKRSVGMKIEKSQVNLATETLNEGEATIEAEVFEAGEPVMIVNEDERIPLPVGEYLLDNGMILIVVEEGVIGEIKEASTEEEEVEEEPVAASDTKSESPLPKSIIESQVREMKFSQEDMDAKEVEIAELKAQITELSKVEEVELSAKPVTHNPEEKSKVTFKTNANMNGKSLEQIIMSKMANL